MTLFLVGSGPTETLHEVHDLFVAEARRRSGRIGVALLGAADEVDGYLPAYTDPILARWPEAEIEPIHLDDEGNTQWPDDFERLAALVVCGGWTPGYLDALARRRDEVSRLVRGGMPYLGYSAGAVIVSRHAVVGGWQLHGRQVAPEINSEGMDEVTIQDGLALIGPCVVTHADAWSGIGLALAALETTEARTAVTIDEGTCLLVNPTTGRTAVSGAGRLHWLQREATHVTITHEEEPARPAPSPTPEDAVHVKPSQLPQHVRPHPADDAPPEAPEPSNAPDAPEPNGSPETPEPNGSPEAETPAEQAGETAMPESETPSAGEADSSAADQ